MRAALLLVAIVQFASAGLVQPGFGVLEISSPPEVVPLDTGIVPAVSVYADSENTNDTLRIFLTIGTTYSESMGFRGR